MERSRQVHFPTKAVQCLAGTCLHAPLWQHTSQLCPPKMISQYLCPLQSRDAWRPAAELVCAAASDQCAEVFLLPLLQAGRSMLDIRSTAPHSSYKQLAHYLNGEGTDIKKYNFWKPCNLAVANIFKGDTLRSRIKAIKHLIQKRVRVLGQQLILK